MERAKARRPVWTLGQVIPLLLAAVGLVDFGLRFMSIDPLTFRAWEALVRYRPAGAVFEPNRHYYKARSYGDLVMIGNVREPHQYRPERWTTDALGYRNAPNVMGSEVSAILTGDSFAVGTGVNDDETLPVALSRPGPCVVYNAGGHAGDITPDRILAVARSLKMRNRLVIRLYAESADVPALPRRSQIPLKKLVAWTPGDARVLVGRVRGFLTVSPLQILIGHVVKPLENDRILPNGHAVNVVKATLRNGDSMLFWAPEVKNFYRRREVAVGPWVLLRDEMRRARLDLLVVLVPSKYTVYRPFLVNQGPAGPGADYLDRLERALRAAGIPILNLTPLLSSEAARALQHGEYLYWLDDLHWNARGIALAAEAIRARWPLAEASCRAPHPPAAQKPRDQTRIMEHASHGPS